MPISEAERDDLIKLLKDFHDNGLLQYRWFVMQILNGKCTKKQWGEFQTLRLDLMRSYGALEEVIEEYGGPAVVEVSGRERGAINFALGSTQPTKGTLIALDGAITVVNKAIGKLQSLPSTRVEAQYTETTQPPKAFIAHGGQTARLKRLCDFLRALGVEPVVAEWSASEGRWTGEHVDKLMNDSDCTLFLRRMEVLLT